MPTNQRSDILAYVKVEVRSRSRKPWGWSLYQDSNNILPEKSAELYQCAVDAWQAGQIALNQYMPVRGKQPKRAKSHLMVDQE
jgi:hypothetical protein